MKLKSILLLEPFNRSLSISTKRSQYTNDTLKMKVIAYFAWIIRKKLGVSATGLHSIPLGLAQISSIIKDECVSTSHIPFILDAIERTISDEEIEKRISSHDYDEVWMSVGSSEASLETLRYAKIVKKINEETPVIVGGIMPSMYPEYFLKNVEIDYLIRGPAEVAAKQYVNNSQSEEFKKIQGFCYRTNSGKINISSHFAIEPDLSKVPPYDFEGMCIDKYMKKNNFCNLQVSRGCPYNCPFCLHVKFWGLNIKYRPISNLKKEMKVLQDHGCNAGFIIDSTFALNKQKLRDFVDAYKKQDITITFMVQTRPNIFTKKVAALLARTNIKIIWFGGESGSLEVLRRLRGKDFEGGKKHLEDLRKAIQICNEYDFVSGSSWVIGLPGENKNTIQETKKVIFDLTEKGMDISDVRILQIFPGTSYWENPEKWGLKVIRKEMPIISTKKSPWDNTSAHETEELTSKEIVEAATEIKKELLELYLDKMK